MPGTKGDVHFVLTVDVTLREEAAVLRRLKPGVAVRVQPAPALRLPRAAFARPPLVVGAGPAGLFAALTLAQAGARPILIERGKAVEKRALDVEHMSQAGELNPESNVQFGEGGAGAFSDGKLTTGIKSPHQQTVLETFVRHGAAGGNPGAGQAAHRDGSAPGCGGLPAGGDPSAGRAGTV